MPKRHIETVTCVSYRVRQVGRIVTGAMAIVGALFVQSRMAHAQPVALRYALGARRTATGMTVLAAGTAADSETATYGERSLFAELPEKVKPSPWWAPVASLVLPGSGQLALGQQRSVAYAVAEAYMLVQAVASQRDADRQRAQYQTLASDVARAQFGGSRPIGPWVTYYEPMERFLESGAYSLVRGTTVVPETDEGSLNVVGDERFVFDHQNQRPTHRRSPG